MDRPPTLHRPRPRPPNSDCSPPHSDEGCNVNPLQHSSESSVVLPVQNDIAISVVATSSWNTTAPTPMPPTSCPATFAYSTTCSSPPASPVPSSEELSETEWLQPLSEDFYRTAGLRPLAPKVFSSSSSQPGSCKEPCTSAHTGQASSSEEHSSTVRAQLSSELAETEDRSSSELAEIDEDRFRHKRLSSVFPSSSSEPGSCEEPCTSAHAGQAFSPEEDISTVWAKVLDDVKSAKKTSSEMVQPKDRALSRKAEIEDPYVKVSSEFTKDCSPSNLAEFEGLGRFYRKWLSSGVPPLPPKVSPSLSSQPGSCEESWTSAHAGQASSSEPDETEESRPAVTYVNLD